MSLKNPVTLWGIDPWTVRLVAQRLNHYATPGPGNLQWAGGGVEYRAHLISITTVVAMFVEQQLKSLTVALYLAVQTLFSSKRQLRVSGVVFAERNY